MFDWIPHLSWPWEPGVDGFWKSFYAAFAAFVLTVGLALCLERRRRRAEAENRLAIERKIIEAFVAALLRELMVNRAWAEGILTKSRKVIKTGKMQGSSGSGPGNSVWDGANTKLLEYGIPRNDFHVIADAYQQKIVLETWQRALDNLSRDRRLLHALNYPDPVAEERDFYVLIEPIAYKAAARITLAANALIDFAKSVSIDFQGGYADDEYLKDIQELLESTDPSPVDKP